MFDRGRGEFRNGKQERTKTIFYRTVFLEHKKSLSIVSRTMTLLLSQREPPSRARAASF